MVSFKSRARLREVRILTKNSPKITHLFVCGYEYEVSVDAQHEYVHAPYPLFVLILPAPSPPQDRCWHGAGFEPASTALSNCRELPGPRVSAAVRAATAVP